MTVFEDDFVPYFLHVQDRTRRNIAAILASQQGGGDDAVFAPPVDLLLQAVLVPGARVPEGHLVAAVAIPWFEIIDRIRADPSIIHQIDWRKWEEIIAAAYKQAGFEVILTPRSNDKGRDVIATRLDVGTIRIIDQVKAYSPGTLVKLDDIHAMLGVLSAEPNVSKGVITTTSTFAPGIMKDPRVTQFMPFRLELKDRDKLLPWLDSLAGFGQRNPSS